MSVLDINVIVYYNAGGRYIDHKHIEN